jgi:hypothetical protein
MLSPTFCDRRKRMFKKLLFPTVALLILGGSIAITPRPASAFHCNDMFCFQTEGNCHPLDNRHCWRVDAFTACVGDDACT